jgi:hypothetical protein
MTTYQSIEERDQVRRKAAVQEACHRVEAAGGPDKMPYSRALHDVHRERGIRWPHDLPETSPTERAPAAPRIAQPVLEAVVKEACRRVEAAGGVHRYSFEAALGDVKKDRSVPSAGGLITPEAIQAEYRVRNWAPLPTSIPDLVRVVRSSAFPMPYRIMALALLRTEQGDDRPTTEIDVRNFAFGRNSQGDQ